MQTTILEKVTILSIFPCWLEYGEGELTTAEEQAGNAWQGDYAAMAIREHGESARVIYQYGESSEFAVCDITGERGDCVEVEIIAIHA